jgi:serine/threonine protein kinase/WD40 repeat protein
MNPSDSLHIDENLARLLAAYDQGLGEADGRAQTIDLPPPGEQRVGTLSGSRVNQGSLSDLLPDPPKPDPFSTPATPEVHRVGRFELRKQLGRGGCGIVFLAHDPKLKRDVALKIPRPELLLSADARRRLLREATAAAAFDHPNLVPVYETGEIGPVCFIASVFCPGQTLSEWLDRQVYPVPIRQAARLVALLAEAVQHAHDRGVLHRDLKPNNVILQEVRGLDPAAQEAPPGSCALRGDVLIPRIVDFGLAKIADQGPGETATRQVLGTPKYMAPEQAQARHEDIGPEADVYALGVILYELLTGCAPYEGATDVEVLRQCIEGNLTPPRNLRREVPRDLEAICLKAMARTPTRRYRTALDFADDLRRFLDGLPTLARPLNGIGRAGRWLRRNDQLFALVTVSTISVILLACGMWNAWQTQRNEVVRSETELREAERIRYENRRLYTEGVRDAFASWRAGDLESRDQLLHGARQTIGRNGENPEFAWRFVSALPAIEHARAVCPAGEPVAVAVAGPWLATAHPTGTLTIWSREPLQPVSAISVHEKGITHLAALDESRFVTTSGETVRVWIVNEKGQVQAGPALSRGTPIVALAADRTSVVLGLKNGHVERWTPSDNAVRTWTISGTIRSVAISSDSPFGAFVAVAASRIHVGRADSDELTELKGLTGDVVAFVRIKNAPELAVVDELGLRLYSPNGLPSSVHPAHGVVASLAASPDGLRLIGATAQGLTLWPIRLQDPLRIPHDEPVRAVAFAPDGRTAYLVSAGGLRAVEANEEPFGPASRDFGDSIVSIAVRSEGGEHAIAFSSGAVDVFPGQGAAPRRVSVRAAISLVRYPESGPLLGMELGQSHAAVWELSDSPRVLFKAPGRFTAADLNAAANAIALGDAAGRVKVWSLADGAELGSVDTETAAPVRQLSLSESGRWLVVPAAKGELGLWSIGEPAIRFRLPGEGAGLVRFLGNDQVAYAGPSGTIRVWNTATLREDARLIGHAGRVSALAVTADQRTLLSGGADGETKLWDLRTSREILTVRRHGAAVLAAEFAPDGRTLYTAGAGRGHRGELHYWLAPRE